MRMRGYAEEMQVRVLFFGVLKEIVGSDQQMMEVAPAATVAELLALFTGETSKQSGIWTRVAVAINREYAERSRVLVEGDEVALLPPVSGGW